MSTGIAGSRQNRTLESVKSEANEKNLPLRYDLITALLLLFGHVPLVLTYVRRLMLFKHYEFVPLLGIGICILVWRRLKEVSREELLEGIQTSVPVRRLWVSGFTLAIATLFGSPWVAMLSLILSLGMFLHSLSGSRWKEILPVWALTFLMIRPPLHLDLRFIKWLQLETSQVASLALERLGVLHLMQGNVIVVPERRFLVEQACSGIHSVFALLTASAFYAVCMRTPKLRGLLLMVSSVFWACVMNLVRIVLTVLVYEDFDIHLSTGWAHTATGLVTFFVAVVFLAFTDFLVRFFLDPIDQHKVTYWKQEGNPFVRRWNGKSSRHRSSDEQPPSAVKTVVPPQRMTRAAPVLTAGFTVLAILWQVYAVTSERIGSEAPAAIANLAPESLPFQLGDWVQVDFDIQQREKDPVLSDVSKMWTYRGASVAALVSIDYPFRGWHQLSGCYEAQGWEIDAYQAVPLSAAPGRAMSEVRMHRPTGEQALLLFVVMDEIGRPLHDPAVESLWLQIAGRAIERIQRPFAQHVPGLAPNSTVTTQLQMLITSPGQTIPASVSEQARSHFNDLQANVAGLLTTESAVAMKGDTP
ncbi:MAG: exosortase U [Planctomycetaceae bacterium]|nr:exosortase U [Planctomycetaceae bacterium]